MSASRRSMDQNNASNPKRFNRDGFDLSNLSDDHQFLLPNDILPSMLGLFFRLTKKDVIRKSFSQLYFQHGSTYFHQGLIEVRRKLDPNPNSIVKSIIINRWLSEHKKDPGLFAQHLDRIFIELSQRMSAFELQTWDETELQRHVRAWQERQTQRRLSYAQSPEPDSVPSILTLRIMTSKLCTQLIERSKSDRKFWIEEGQKRLKDLINNSFIIVAQPTSRDGQPVTQYEKLGRKPQDGHKAKLLVRVISLLDAHLHGQLFRLSSIKVKVSQLNAQANDPGEEQESIVWKTRDIISSQGHRIPILYFELDSITMKQLDQDGKLPLYNSKRCRCEFNFPLDIIEPSMSLDMNIVSEPFGITSNPQYFPTFTASIFLRLIQRTPHDQRMLLNLILGYHTLVTGVQPNQYTQQYLQTVLKNGVQDQSDHGLPTTDQKLLASIFEQIEMFHSYPFLSLMYWDGVFLGICDPKLDEEVRGNIDEAQILLRFQSLTPQNANTEAIRVRHIAHDGRLTRSTFDGKDFVRRITVLIIESSILTIVPARMFSLKPNLTIQDFCLYYDDDLHRISGIPPLDTGKYKPIVPCLPRQNLSTDQTNGQAPASPVSNDDPIEDCMLIVNPSENIQDCQVYILNDENTTEALRMKLVVDRRLVKHKEALRRHIIRAVNEFAWMSINDAENQRFE